MKKIIELAEKITYDISNTEYDMQDVKELMKHICKRRMMEQAPITEDWLKKHGWQKVQMFWYYQVNDYITFEWYGYESRLTRFYDTYEVTDKMHCHNLAQLLDALELCGITMED